MGKCLRGKHNQADLHRTRSTALAPRAVAPAQITGEINNNSNSASWNVRDDGIRRWEHVSNCLNTHRTSMSGVHIVWERPTATTKAPIIYDALNVSLHLKYYKSIL